MFAIDFFAERANTITQTSLLHIACIIKALTNPTSSYVISLHVTVLIFTLISHVSMQSANRPEQRPGASTSPVGLWNKFMIGTLQKSTWGKVKPTVTVLHLPGSTLKYLQQRQA